MDIEAKMELYEILFNIGQQIIDHHDPCEWKDGACRRMRSSDPDAEVCCKGCPHLGETGCTVKSLACKLWLCGDSSNRFKECMTELKIIRMVADYCGIPYGDRKSKEEDFGRLPGEKNSQTRRHR
jgi:hypothetical protein